MPEMLGAGFLPQIDLDWWMLIPAAIGVIGFGMILITFKALSGTRIIIVPQGEDPAAWYRRWKSLRWTRRYSRKFFFMMAMSVGMMLSGCGTVLVKAIW